MWGCGGVEALESQQKMKDWAQKEIVRRQQVGAWCNFDVFYYHGNLHQINRRQLRANWMDSPDRAILEMGGVEADRPTDRPQ